MQNQDNDAEEVFDNDNNDFPLAKSVGADSSLIVLQGQTVAVEPVAFPGPTPEPPSISQRDM